MRRALVLSLCFFPALLLAADPASGSCSGPQVSVEPASAVRGAALVVSGSGWGDGSCFDTGVPPDGHGVLGKPGTGIAVEVRQGERTVQLAEIDANADYTFRFGASLPNDVVEGPAVVIARIAAPYGWRTAESPLVVRAETAVGAADSESTTTIDHRSRDDAARLAMVLATAAAAIATSVIVRRRRRSRVRS